MLFFEKTGEILGKCAGLDGLVCAMQYLREHEIAVPQTILVAGHGDSEITRMTVPSLLSALL